MRGRLFIMGDFDFWALGSEILVAIELFDDSDDTEINDAVVTSELKDVDGVSIDAPAFISTTSGGRYLAEIADGIGLVEGEPYTLEVTATKDAVSSVFRLTRRAKQAIGEVAA